MALYPATTSSSERVSFHTLNRATGHRVKRQFVDAETGAVVETEDQVKGYEIGKGEHLIVEDDELADLPVQVGRDAASPRRGGSRPNAEVLTCHSVNASPVPGSCC